MTQYYEDFSGYTVGDDPTTDGPAEFTERWHTGNGSVEIVSNANAPSGKAMRLSLSTFARYAVSYDPVDADANRDEIEVKVLAEVGTQSSNGSNIIWAAGRGSGNSSSETAYVARLIRSSNQRRLAYTEYSSGGANGSQEGNSNAYDNGDTVWLTIRISGTSITYNVADESTPGTPTDSDSITDSTISGVGWAGTGAFSHTGLSPAYVDVLAISFGTNGDNAPTSDPGGDVTAPVLSSPTGTQTGSSTATGTVSTDEANGLLDAVVTTSATTPSVAQIQAGQDHTGAAAAATDLNNIVSATGVQNVSFTGLTAATTYYVHYVHQDAAGNDSNTVTSASFTTSASVTEGFTLNLNDGSTDQINLTGIYCVVWDADNPDATAPDFFSSTETTNGNGDITVDLSSISGLAVSDNVYVVLWKPDATVADSLGWQGRLTVTDIG